MLPCMNVWRCSTGHHSVHAMQVTQQLRDQTLTAALTATDKKAEILSLLEPMMERRKITEGRVNELSTALRKLNDVSSALK